MMEERRIEERAECAIAAKIELSERLAIAVILRDLSTEGVRLQVDESVHLPDMFDLLVPVVDTFEQRYRVAAVWRKGNMVGGEFLKPAGPATDAIAAMDAAIEGDRGKRKR